MIAVAILAALPGCGEPADAYGPLSDQLVGEWTSVTPGQQSWRIEADFGSEWEQRESATFATGSPDTVTLADGTVLDATGATAANGAIDPDESFTSGATFPRITLTFAADGSATRTRTDSADATDAVTEHFASWSDDGAGTLTLVASDTGAITGSSRTMTRIGTGGPLTRDFAITPGNPPTLAFMGLAFLAQGPGDTLITGSPWVMDAATQGRNVALTVSGDRLLLRDVTHLPPGSSTAGQEFFGHARVWRHDYDGASATGTLRLRADYPAADYTIAEQPDGSLWLTISRLAADDSPFTCVREVTGLAHQIRLFGHDWFRNGGAAGSILGHWTDGSATGRVEFRADGTFTITDDAGSRVGHWRRSGRRYHYQLDEVYQR